MLTAFTDPMVGFQDLLPNFNDDVVVVLASVAPPTTLGGKPAAPRTAYFGCMRAI